MRGKQETQTHARMEKPTIYLSVICPKTWGWGGRVKPHQHTTLLAGGNYPVLLSSASDPPKPHVRSYLTGTVSCP